VAGGAGRPPARPAAFSATSVAAMLGLVMILLKDLVLIHLH
jgi:hypothetical protein